jgi:hypothetical protein
VILGSVYGPNVTDLSFFEKLARGIKKMNPKQEIPKILGGDWNCTYSADPVSQNIDVLNMADLLNRSHSKKLAEMCCDLKLADPYRILHFNSVDFTYIPRCETQANRSRIDFFLVSESIVDLVSSCDIKYTLQNRLFDHKAIVMEINSKKVYKKGRQVIDNKIMSSDIIDFVIHCAVAETYVHHIRHVNNRDALLNSIGQLKVIIFNLGLHWSDRPGEDVIEDANAARDGLLNRARYLLTLLDIRVFENAELACDADIFMEVLVNNVRNETCSYQAFFLKEKKKSLWRV